MFNCDNCFDNENLELSGLELINLSLRGVRTGHNSTRVNAHLRVCIVAFPPSNSPTFCIDLIIWRYSCAGPNLRLQDFQWWRSISRMVRNEVSTATLKGVRLLLSDWYEVYDYSPRSKLLKLIVYCGLRHTSDSSQGFLIRIANAIG